MVHFMEFREDIRVLMHHTMDIHSESRQASAWNSEKEDSEIAHLLELGQLRKHLHRLRLTMHTSLIKTQQMFSHYTVRHAADTAHCPSGRGL